jgi:hypothetical protein
MKKFRNILISLVLLFLLAYFIKSQLRINLFKSESISNYFPFNYFQPDAHPVDADPQVGILLHDGFELEFWSESKWADLWAREKRLVKSEYVTEGVDRSGCLLIKSNSAKEWAMMHYEPIAVKAGDRFGYEGKIRTEGDSEVSLSVQTYNEKRRVINWSYAAKTVTAATDWVELKNEFEIPPDIKYIQFGLKGSGKGRAWIDDVTFSKLK